MMMVVIMMGMMAAIIKPSIFCFAGLHLLKKSLHKSQSALVYQGTLTFVLL
jgi:hypothetical protein